MRPESILVANELTKHFGGICAVKELSFHVGTGEIVGLIGPNGAGKTTVYDIVTGFCEPDEGVVEFEGETITGLRPDQIARRGISRVFQLPRIFKKMTVLQNVLVASQEGINEGTVERARGLLQLTLLGELEDHLGEELSYGQQRLLEFARALMQNSELILLDEPLAGVHPVLARKLLDRIADLRRAGKTFMLVEHNMLAVTSVCDRIIVLDHGEKICEGDVESIKKDERVIEAYLGRR